MVQRPSEDDLIARYFAPMAGAGALGLRDDAALLTPPAGCDLVLTKDALVAGVHFFADDPPEAIAAKALRVNLSDLAAKGAICEGFLLGLALPPGWTEDWLARFATGLAQDAKKFACPLLGGDTVATSGPLTLSITAIGSVASGAMVRRTTARAGDLLYVSGTIGDSALGLALRKKASAGAGLSENLRAHLLQRYLLPEPRVSLSAALARHASAAMDISDGLVGDLAKMLGVSGVSAIVDIEAIPLSDAARKMIAEGSCWLETALTGGDDYEILASVPTHHAATFEAAAAAVECPVKKIGLVIAGVAAPQLRVGNGAPMHFARGSFQHF